jgi:hypothetical protein
MKPCGKNESEDKSDSKRHENNPCGKDERKEISASKRYEKPPDRICKTPHHTGKHLHALEPTASIRMDRIALSRRRAPK